MSINKIQQFIFYICSLIFEDRIFTRILQFTNVVFVLTLIESTAHQKYDKKAFEENIYSGQQVLQYHALSRKVDQPTAKKQKDFSLKILSVNTTLTQSRIDQSNKSKHSQSAGNVDLPKDLSEYLAVIKQRIEDHRYYPLLDQSAGNTALITLQLTLDTTGNTLSRKITNPSSYPSLNQAAIESVIRAEPFPPFPHSLQEKQQQLTVEFGLDYCLSQCQ